MIRRLSKSRTFWVALCLGAGVVYLLFAVLWPRLKRQRDPASRGGVAETAGTGTGAGPERDAARGTDHTKAPPSKPDDDAVKPNVPDEPAGSQPSDVWQRIRSVAGGFGLSCDVSDCKVVLDGEPVQGDKTLSVLGAALFLNEHQVFPRIEKGIAPRIAYTHSLSNEASLLYLHLLNQDPSDRNAAINRVAAFASRLPGVVRVEPHDHAITFHCKRGLPWHQMFTPWPRKPSESQRECLDAREELGVSRRLKDIAEALAAGKTLHIKTGGEYSVE